MKQFEGNWIFEKDKVVQDFKTTVESFLTNEEAFSTFKTNPSFCHVIGNDVLPKNTADVLYKILENELHDLDIELLRKYKTNDLIGNPLLYHYELTGVISPGTLYFIRILRNIEEYFGNLNELSICEIGGGYGGQAKIILDKGVKNYSIIDIEPTLGLAKKYLSYFEHKNISFIPTTEIEVKEYDLVISNWCISELDKEGMIFYVNNVIKNCKYGYFLMNSWDDRKDFLINEIKKLGFTTAVLDEYPKTSVNNNCLLVIKR